MEKLAILTICLSILAAVGSSANAQGRQCGARAAVLDQLAAKYGETRRSVGLGQNNTLIEIFASDASGSWTILATQATGITCLVASGQSYEELAAVEAVMGDDA